MSPYRQPTASLASPGESLAARIRRLVDDLDRLTVESRQRYVAAETETDSDLIDEPLAALRRTIHLRRLVSAELTVCIEIDHAGEFGRYCEQKAAEQREQNASSIALLFSQLGHVNL